MLEAELAPALLRRRIQNDRERFYVIRPDISIHKKPLSISRHIVRKHIGGGDLSPSAPKLSSRIQHSAPLLPGSDCV